MHKNQCNNISHFVVFMFLLMSFSGQEVKGVNSLKHPYLFAGDTNSELAVPAGLLCPCSHALPWALAMSLTPTQPWSGTGQ